MDSLEVLRQDIVACEACPRLITHCRTVAQVKRRAFLGEEYWGRPLPGWGDPEARVLLLGLAPAAHGGNRTGRMFTGDRSGTFLFQALYDAGFARLPGSTARGDGQELLGAYMSNAVRCAPPDNRPAPAEIKMCQQFLAREIALLPKLTVVMALGKLAFDVYLTVLQDAGVISSRGPYVFGHNREYAPMMEGPRLIASYHPSQQNTSTGRLTAEMMRAVMERVREVLATDVPCRP